MQLQKILVVLGPPGSGKGTQSSLLAKALGFEQIVIGDLIREFIKGTSQQALVAKVQYDKGIPQPDGIVINLLKDKLQNVHAHEGAVFDTFPLSIGQALALDQIAGDLGVRDTKVIFLNVGKEEVVKRIIGRGQGRSDDKPEIAAARFDEYEKRNEPIKDFYKSKDILIEINGDQQVVAVHQEILSKLGLK